MKTKQMRSIDLSLFPKLGKIHAWISMDDAIARHIKRLRRVSDRVFNAMRFLWFSQYDAEHMGLGREADRLREGFMRAMLAELVSVEEVLPMDLEDIGMKARVLKLHHTPLPHVHLIREMRNHELHLHHNKLLAFQRNLLWGRMDQPEKATATTVNLWVLDGVSFESFSKLKNAELYLPSDLKSMIDWFNETQNEWGVHEILLLAINDYAATLCEEYRL